LACKRIWRLSCPVLLRVKDHSQNERADHSFVRDASAFAQFQVLPSWLKVFGERNAKGAYALSTDRKSLMTSVVSDLCPSQARTIPLMWLSNGWANSPAR
jgi:hypothetical protein